MTTRSPTPSAPLQPAPAAMDPRARSALHCAQTLMDLVPSLMDEVRRHMRASAPPGISVPQMRLLIYARRHGGASLTEVAEHLGVTLPTVSVAAQRLIDAGWLASHPHPDDRRRSAISLTPAGAAVVKTARQHTRSEVAARLRDADTATLQTIRAGLQALGRTLGAADHTPPDSPPPPVALPAPRLLRVEHRSADPEPTALVRP